MTMEMTTPVPSQCLLKWKLVVVARRKEPDKVKKDARLR